MPFSEGQTIVHPAHGPVTIVETTRRELGGESVPYFQMVALEHPLTISVPIDSAEELGLRPISSPAEIADLLELLGAPSAPGIPQWARRVKDYEARMATGRLPELCFVIRQVTRAGDKPRASAEGQLLRTARSAFALEVSLALSITREQAEITIDAAVLSSNAA